MPNNHTSRRSILKLPVIGAGLAVAAPVTAISEPNEIVDLINELENSQGWEQGSVVMAKAYVAYRLRLALGMETGSSSQAKQHIASQASSYERYKGTYLYELDFAEGRPVAPPSEFLPTLAS